MNDTIVKVTGTRTDTENDGKLTVDLGNSDTMTIYHEEADDDVMAQLLIDTATIIKKIKDKLQEFNK